MKSFLDWALELPLPKIAVIGAFAIVGAVLPTDLKPKQRIATFFIGFLAALVFGDPLRSVMGLPETWAYGMAGVLAMTGRNIAVFVIRISRDPAAFARTAVEIWRGGKLG
ncbi:MAG: hypothetical protein ABJO52_00295 [Nisaea sp.]|uniref:hypothetical protein n=1 Tax=Alphaproteobacteria TaxID=28211 RepID=UPI003299AE52